MVFVRWCQGHLLYVWLSGSGLRMVCLLAGDLPAHPELPPSPRTGYACDQCLLEHDRLCGGLCLWPVSGSSGGCGAVGGPWTPIRACHPVRTVKAGPRVFLLSAAWTTGWQGESGGGRGLEPRTRSAHRLALGSEPWACLTSTSCFLMCEGRPLPFYGPTFGSWGPFCRESHALGVLWRSLCHFDTWYSVWV